MVVEVRVERRAIAVTRGQEPAVAPGGPAQRVGGVAREVDPARHGERVRGAREARDRQRVPRREDLVVEAGMHARLARLEQARACARETRVRVELVDPQALRDGVERLAHARIPRVALEIRRPVEAVIGLGDDPFLVGDRRARLLARPHVEPAFVALAVGVEARVERPVVRAHLAHQPADDVARDVRVAALAGDARSVGVQREQRSVVVEHLLEVRDGPLRVDGVTAEAAAQLIVDAAVGHVVERDAHDREGLRIAVAREGAQAEVELERMRELGRGAKAAVHAIERALQARPGRQRARASSAGAGPPSGSSMAIACARPPVLLCEPVALLAIGVGNLRQQIEEAREPMAPVLRESTCRRRTARPRA